MDVQVFQCVAAAPSLGSVVSSDATQVIAHLGIQTFIHPTKLETWIAIECPY